MYGPARQAPRGWAGSGEGRRARWLFWGDSSAGDEGGNGKAGVASGMLAGRCQLACACVCLCVFVRVSAREEREIPLKGRDMSVFQNPPENLVTQVYVFPS